MTKPLFKLGQIVSTPGALEAINPELVLHALARHASGDWGDLCKDDKQLNDQSLTPGDEGRLHSAYEYERQPKFWIITEWDRSVTTILLPEEY